MKIEGACHCGAIAYEAEIDPQAVSICHCVDCQTLSGAPFRASVPVRGKDFRLLRGTPKAYVKIAQSGNKRVQGFCADCGTPIYSTSDEAEPAVYMLRVGPLAQRAQLVPRLQIWAKSALGWAQNIAGLKAVDGNIPK